MYGVTLVKIKSTHGVCCKIGYFLAFGRDRHRISDCEMGIIYLLDHAPLHLLSVYITHIFLLFWDYTLVYKTVNKLKINL